MGRCKNCMVGLLDACAGDYCRSERELLLEEARQKAELNGHSLTRFVKVKDYPIWNAKCSVCGQPASINLDPAVNQEDIYGAAVTGRCKT